MKISRSCTFLALVGLAAGIAFQPGHAATVGPNNRDYTSIDAALRGAPAGEPIIVDPGIYSEPRLTVSGRNLSSRQPTEPGATTITNSDGRAVIQAANATIEGFTITGGNNAGGHGGGVAVSGGQVVLKYLTIVQNTAGFGGGVGGITGSSEVTIENCTIRNNSATTRGGGVEGVPGSTTITNSVITNNVVSNGSASGIGAGGGVFLPTFSSGLIKNTEVTMNQAIGTRFGAGGGIYSHAILILSGVTLQTNNAINGTSTSNGGGLYISRLGATHVYGGPISGNSAGLGGGVYVAGGSGVVSLNAAISGNTATGTLPDGVGGGVYCGAPIQTLSGTVSGNTPDQIVGCAHYATPPVGTTRTAADNEQSGNSNDPVNTRTGALYNQYDPDLNFHGPMPLFFARYYSSGFKQVGIFANLGDNWRHNFDWRLTFVGTTIHIIDHHGRTIQFVQNGTAWNLAGKTDIAYQLEESAGRMILLDPRSQRSYAFDSAGLLLSISDGRGNVHTLSYADGPLTRVSDGLGRTLNFSYDRDARLTVVDDGLGRSVRFTYTGSYLTGVTDLTGETTVYNYSTAHSNLRNWGLFTTMVRPEGNTPFEHRYWFADRRSSSELDSNGHQTIFRYVSDTETTIEDPLGNIRTHTHTATGELSGSTDNAGRVIAIGADPTGRRNSITDRLGDVTTMSYHAPSGKLASRTHPDGATTSYTYEARAIGNNTAYDLTGKTHADRTTESFEYDALGRLTSHVDRQGKTAEYTYNAAGQLLTASNRLGGTNTATYNADGTIETTIDPAGNPTNYDHDAFRRLDQITRADGSTVETTYDDADRPLTTTDENGEVTTLTYDRNGNLASVVDPRSNPVTFAYDGNDRLLRITDSLNGIYRRTYDERGRLGSTIDPLDQVTTFGYDIHNRPITVTDPSGEIWSTSYDLEGVIASRTDPLLNPTTYRSDKLGRITEIRSPLGNATGFTYDAMGRIITATDALGRTTTFSHDALGLLSEIALPGGVIRTSYARNAVGQPTDLTDPNGNRWKSSYDSSGRLTARTDPLLQTADVTYDNRNRPSVITLPGGLGTQTTTYDPAGNLLALSYSDGTTLAFSYDANDRLITARSGALDDVTRSYDANSQIDNSNGIAVARDLKGRITSMSLGPGKKIDYAHDANDRLTSVTDWAGGLISFSYDAAGRLTGVIRPNGVNTANTWDDDSRLTGIDESGVSSIALTRDAVGQITSATRNVPQAAGAPVGINRSFSFDAAAQLKGATYDAAGRLIAKGPDTFTWDLANRLTSSMVDGTAVGYTYDALGRRTSRTAGGVTRDYLWNDALGLSSISVEKESGANHKYYVHTPGGDLLYSIDAATDARNFLHYDELGNTLFVTDDAGAVIGSYAFTPYGQLTASSGNLDHPFTWQGRFGVMDEGDGLYYVRARYYDSGAGRFISRDPVHQSDPRSVNPYQYALGNPMRFVDPSGENALDVLEAELARAAVTLANAELELARANAQVTKAPQRHFSVTVRDKIIRNPESRVERAARLSRARFHEARTARNRARYHFLLARTKFRAEKAQEAMALVTQAGRNAMQAVAEQIERADQSSVPTPEGIIDHYVQSKDIESREAGAFLKPWLELCRVPFPFGRNGLDEIGLQDLFGNSPEISSNREAQIDPTNPDQVEDGDNPDSVLSELESITVQ